MPPRARAKPASALAGLVGSDSEPDLDAFDEAEIQAARTMSVTKKPRGRPPRTANKVTKTTASSTRRGSGMLSAVPESATRPSTTTKTNSGMAGAGGKTQQDVQDETVTFDDIEALPSVTSTVTKKGTRGRPRSVPPSASKNANNDTSVLVPPSAAKRRGRPPRQAVVKPPEEIPETQQEDAMELDVVVEEEEEDINGAVAPVAEPLESWAGYDGSEVSLRRRLGELSKKYENLDMRHRDLREVGVKEAERNFERLKKQAEERTAAANQLIAELKAELAAQTALAKEGEQLRQQLEESEAKAEDLEATIEELTGSLSEAKSEIKTLSTKLAAVRSGDVNSRVPGSAMKAGGLASRTAQAEAAHATQATAQAKEDLYADLTDLIIRGVRQEEMEDVFDCIQTGRNGSLHFKLAVETAEASDSYEDTQFTYRPQLDSNRDGELMDMLPDYLIEEITFPRPQASRFYARVVKSLTERIE